MRSALEYHTIMYNKKLSCFTNTLHLEVHSSSFAPSDNLLYHRLWVPISMLSPSIRHRASEVHAMQVLVQRGQQTSSVPNGLSGSMISTTL